MTATIGWWLMVLVPILLAAVFGFDSYRDGFFKEKTMGTSLIAAGLIFLFGVTMYAPEGMVLLEGTSLLLYFILALLYGVIAFALCVLVWQTLFYLLKLVFRGMVEKDPLDSL